MGIKLTNNANATLAASINSSATSITLTSGQGARFPTLAGGDHFYATLVDTSNNLEIVKCTARSTDVLTVVRAQESTTARAYTTGDRIEIRLTAQTFIDAVNEIGPTQVSDEANSSTGYFDMPAGTTAQRPGSPVAGMQRWNTDLVAMEYYNGTAWSTNFQQTYPVEYLVVAGGGGGGGGIYHGGGGGAGGYRSSVTAESSGGGAAAESPLVVTAGISHTVTIGGGGSGVPGTTGGSSGTNSTFHTITSIGGGLGGTYSGSAPASGGSGGGCDYQHLTPGSGTTGQGYAGGTGAASAPNYGGGGGGGAGAVGVNGTSTVGGNGGIGVQSSINNTATYRAGGGGGSVFASGTPGSGGTGGGGAGCVNGNTQAVSGSPNTGGGGGGAERATFTTGGGGGSGIVILRYASATQRGTGGTVTTYTSGATTYWVHTFTTSGTFVS